MTVNDDRLDGYVVFSDWWKRWKAKMESIGCGQLIVESGSYAERVTVRVSHSKGWKKRTELPSDQFEKACQCDVGDRHGDGLIGWILRQPPKHSSAEQSSWEMNQGKKPDRFPRRRSPEGLP